MPKMKTNRTAAKRFKITSSGKLKYRKSKLNHLLHKKRRGGRLRRMRTEGEVPPSEMRRMRKLLPGL